MKTVPTPKFRSRTCRLPNNCDEAVGERTRRDELKLKSRSSCDQSVARDENGNRPCFGLKDDGDSEHNKSHYSNEGFQFRRRRKRRILKSHNCNGRMKDMTRTAEQSDLSWKDPTEHLSNGRRLAETVRVGKRRRRVYGKIENFNEETTPKTMTIKPDSFRFDNRPYPPSSDNASIKSKQQLLRQKVICRSLPSLLHLREIGASRNMVRQQCLSQYRHTAPWHTLVLKQPIQRKGKDEKIEKANVEKMTRTWEWRPYARRFIPFSQLETPLMDAILAMDRSGSYMISLGGGFSRDEMALNSAQVTAIEDDGRSEVWGGGGWRQSRPVLALRFYGIPSPATVERKRNWRVATGTNLATEVSPLLHVIPLLLDTSDSNVNRNFTAPSSVLGGDGSSAATTPVQILTSSDSAVGVAFLHHSLSSSSIEPLVPNSALVSSPATRDEDTLGTLIVFPLPSSPSSLYFSRSQSLTLKGAGRTQQQIKTYKCANVRIGGWNSYTMRNLLWHTNLIPLKRQKSVVHTPSWNGSFLYDNGFVEAKATRPGGICDSYLSLAGYLLFNDEDDGYRMAWIVVDGSDGSDLAATEGVHDEPAPCEFVIKPAREDIVTVPDEEVWDVCWSDSKTGCPSVDSSNECNQGLRIVFEAYLHIDALLSDVIARRKNVFSLRDSLDEKSWGEGPSQSLPEFYYNLISAVDNGRTVVLVVVFANPNRRLHPVAGKSRSNSSRLPAAFGVFLRLDLFNQSYDEMEWAQHPSRSDSAFLRHWSNALALNYRMKERTVAVFCSGIDSDRLISSRGLHNWGITAHESNTGEDEPDDVNPELWGSYMKAKRQRRQDVNVPKEVAFSSLYPDCDLITNKAVTSGKPVKKIGCRDSPLVLSYG